MVGSLHLTEENILQVATLPGQAHFAINTDNTCRECVHWSNHRGERTRLGLLKPALCRKALRMSPDKLPEVPHQARACKHFEANPTPPAI
jgi:hypothetical protein